VVKPGSAINMSQVPIAYRMTDLVMIQNPRWDAVWCRFRWPSPSLIENRSVP